MKSYIIMFLIEVLLTTACRKPSTTIKIQNYIDEDFTFRKSPSCFYDFDERDNYKYTEPLTEIDCTCLVKKLPDVKCTCKCIEKPISKCVPISVPQRCTGTKNSGTHCGTSASRFDVFIPTSVCMV
ncbi:uncharacterized protein LOC125073768 [Vanessa atalanta]|uniref:uncharacterized protein LOC125073768 n=1 Tax=Vanessa atalanta TaxID=42275 RepID=UPI001FCDBBAA|nr:uncharacterized protein LOC125073768 [Vanessa atalanta]